MSKETQKVAEERINPARITDNETGDVYELDFSRDAVRFAENRGFEVDKVTTFPSSKIPELFFYAFRMNHRNIARDKTDALMEKMGGLSTKLLERLIMLYQQASLTHVIAADEDAGKNANVTVEL